MTDCATTRWSFLASGDHHFHDRRRFDECKRVHAFAADVTQRRSVDAFLSAGDVYEHASSPDERSAAADFLHSVAEHAPVVVAKGNHDRPRDCAILARLRTRHPVVVEEAAGIHRVGPALVMAVAWPSRASLAAMLRTTGNADLSHDALDDVARDALRTILTHLRLQTAQHDGPRVLLMHAMVDGSVTSVGQPLIGAELHVGLADLALAGADMVVLGHIHKPQEWQFGAVPIVYTGSPYRTSFGETEDKGLVFGEWERTASGWHLAGWERVTTPATQMVLAESSWTPAGWTTPPPVDVAGAEVRFRYEFDPDQRDGARRAAEAVREQMLAAGAVVVQVEASSRSVSRSRAADVASAPSLEEKLRRTWKLRGRDVSEERAARVSATLATLRDGLPRAQKRGGAVRIDSVRLRGFGPYRNEVAVDWSAIRGELVAVTGRNGEGKSTLLSLMGPGVMYRELPGYGSIAQLATPSSGAGGSFVEARIDLGGGDAWTIRQSVRVTPSGAKGEALVLDAQGQPLDGQDTLSVKRFDAWAASHLPAPGLFYASTFCAQEAGGFGRMSPAARKDLVLALKAGECGDLETLAKKARTSAAEERAALERVDAAILALLSQVGAVTAGIDAVVADLATQHAAAVADGERRAQELAEVRAQVTVEEQAREQAREAAEAARRKADAARAQGQAAVEAAQAQRERAERARQTAQRERDMLASLRAGAEQDLARTRATIAERQQRIAQNRSGLLDRAEEIHAASARLRALDEQVAALTTMLAEHTAAERDLRAESARADATARQHMTEVANAQQAAGRLAAELATLPMVKAAADLLPTAHAAVERARERVERVETRLAALRDTHVAGVEERVGHLRGTLVAIRDGDGIEDGVDAAQAAKVALADDDEAVVLRQRLPADLAAATKARTEALAEHAQHQRTLRDQEALASRLPALEHAQTQQWEHEQRAEDAAAAHKAALAEVLRLNRLASDQADATTVVRDQRRALETERSRVETVAKLEQHLAVAHDRIADHEEAIAQARAQAARAERDLAALPARSPAAEAAEEEARTLEEQATFTDATAAQFHGEAKTADWAAQEAQTEQARAATRLSEIAHRVAGLQYAIDATARREAKLAAEIDSLRSVAETVREKEAERAAAEERLSDWCLLAEGLGKDGLQALEVDAAGPEIAGLATELLHACHGPRWTVVRIDTAPASDEGTKAGCDVIVYDATEGREGRIETFSPGQRTLTGTALTLAITILATRDSGGASPTLVLDEASANLDLENAEGWIGMVRRALRMIGASKAVFVSHLPQLTALADARVLVQGGRVEVQDDA